jgi:hypothetical protein
MERKAVMRFFTLKGLNPGDIHAELMAQLFDQGRTDVSIIRDLDDDPYRMILPKPFTLCFGNVL